MLCYGHFLLKASPTVYLLGYYGLDHELISRLSSSYDLKSYYTIQIEKIYLENKPAGLPILHLHSTRLRSMYYSQILSSY